MDMLELQGFSLCWRAVFRDKLSLAVPVRQFKDISKFFNKFYPVCWRKNRTRSATHPGLES